MDRLDPFAALIAAARAGDFAACAGLVRATQENATRFIARMLSYGELRYEGNES